MGRRRALPRRARSSRRVAGAELVGLRYRGPFDTLAPGAGVEHRVVPWDEVSLEEGTGHRPHRAGLRRRGLRARPLARPAGADAGRRGRPLLRRLRLAARALDRPRPPTRSSATSASAASSSRRAPTSTTTRTAGAATRRSSSASPTTGSSRRRRPRSALLEANATVEWVPAYMGKRMDDWLRNMGDWNISRRRYYGLPLPFYPCACGHLNVIGSKDELRERADRGLRPARGAAPAVDRPRADPLRGLRRGGRARDRGRRRLARRRDRPVLDARLAEPGVDRPSGYATGAAARPDARADLPDHAYWEKWFPADWVTEMREQIRLWFYSQLFMSVVLVGRAPFRRVLGYEKMLDENGREMHGSWGNMIDAEDAFARMGADVMRWQYCAQPPDRNLLFGFGPAHEIKRKLLTLLELGRRSSSTTRTSRASSRCSPTSRRARRSSGRSTAGSSRARTSSCARRPRRYEATLTVDVIRAFEAFVDDLSNWYIRRSRRRFYGDDDGGVPDALVRARPVAARDRAGDAVPHRPPVAEPRAGRRRRRCTSPAGPRCPSRTRALLAEIAEVRRVVELGRQARSTSGLKLRQPLRRLVVAGRRRAPGRTRDEIADELRVKEVEFGDGRGLRAAREAEPAGARPEARPGACARCRAALAEGSFDGARRRPLPRSTATCSSRTRCSSSASASRAGRSPPRTASRSRSTRRSTTSCGSRRASTT